MTPNNWIRKEPLAVEAYFGLLKNDVSLTEMDLYLPKGDAYMWLRKLICAEGNFRKGKYEVVHVLMIKVALTELATLETKFKGNVDLLSKMADVNYKNDNSIAAFYQYNQVHPFF